MTVSIRVHSERINSSLLQIECGNPEILAVQREHKRLFSSAKTAEQIKEHVLWTTSKYWIRVNPLILQDLFVKSRVAQNLFIFVLLIDQLSTLYFFPAMYYGSVQYCLFR